MATSNSRDVELNLRVATVGVDSLQKLQADVAALASEGKIAAESGSELAEQIDRVIKSAGQFNAVAQLEQQVKDLAAATERTGLVAYGTAEDLQLLQERTQQLAAAEERLKSEFLDQSIVAEAARQSLKNLRKDTDDAEKRTVAYNEQKKAAKALIEEENANLAILGQRLRAASQETAAAAEAEAAMAKALNVATKEADGYALALSARNAELRESRAALEEAGVAAGDLAAAERQLIEMQNEAFAATERAKQAEIDRIVALEREAEELRKLAAIEFTTMQEMREASRAEADGIIADAARIEQALRGEAQAAQQAGAAINGAFSTIGAKSVPELRAEIERVRTAMQTLATTGGLTGAELDGAMAAGQRRINALNRDIREATNSLTTMDRISQTLGGSLGQLAAGFVVLDVGSQLARGFLEANIGMEKLRLGLNAVYKDTNLTASQIEFLRQVASRAGVSFTDITPSFVKFAASMQSANIPLSQTNALFAAVTQSAGTLGLSGEKVGEILNALSQMAAKGTVSMEELRQQLGDSLPGALSLTAKGLGITDAELIKLVTSGGLLARDLIPALTTSLQGMAGPVTTTESGWTRLKNILALTATTIGDAGFMGILKGALWGVGAVLGPLVIGFSTLFETITSGVRVSAAVISAFAARDLKSLGPAVKQIFDDAVNRQAKLARAYDDLMTGADDASDANTRVAQTVGAAGVAAGGAAGAVQAHTAAVQGGATAAQGAAAAHTQAAAAVAQGGAQAAAASPNLIRLGLDYADLSKQLQTNVLVTESLVKAREIEAKSMETLAKLSGDERTALDAAVTARTGTLTAMQAELKAREAESAALVVYIGALQKEVELHGDPGGVRQKDIDQRQQKLQTMTAETQKVREQVEAMKMEVVQRQISRQAYEDNSKSLELLKNVMENAKATLAAYIELQKQGFATQEQVDAAALAAAKAQGIYTDALKDTAAASDRLIQTMQAQAAVQRAMLTLDDARARNLAALARSTGDSNLATVASINLKENEIKRLQLAANAQRAEADEIAKKVTLQRAELMNMNQWTPAKEDEYKRTMLGVEAKRIEAQATDENSQALQQEINDMRNGIGARDANTASIDKNTAAQKRNNEAKQEELTADNFKANKDGSAAGTFTNNLPVDAAFRLAQGQITDPKEAKAALDQAKAAQDEMWAYMKNGGAASPEYIQSTTALFTKARTEYEKVQNNAAIEANKGTSHTVTLNVGGTSSKIGVASAADGTNLVDMLKKIQDASRSAA